MISIVEFLPLYRELNRITAVAAQNEAVSYIKEDSLDELSTPESALVFRISSIPLCSPAGTNRLQSVCRQRGLFYLAAACLKRCASSKMAFLSVALPAMESFRI